MSGFPKPASRLDGLRPYRPSRGGPAKAQRLHANEGRSPVAEAAQLTPWLDGLDLARYPSTATLEAALGAIHGVDPERVVVTAGADDALFRLTLAYLEQGRRAVLLEPTFEMIPRYVRLAGGADVLVPWLDTPFPEARFAEALRAESVVVGFVVTPSAPAGEVAPFEAVERLADRAASLGRLLVVDLAYVEFAEADPTERLAARGDVVITRTLSKALGLAGLRLGYALAPVPVAQALRTVGQPYPVSGPSVAVAQAILQDRPAISARARARVIAERTRLFECLSALGARPIRSEANFVLARLGKRAKPAVEALLDAGYRVRLFDGAGPLEGAVRISCPQDEGVLHGLLSTLERVLHTSKEGLI